MAFNEATDVAALYHGHYAKLIAYLRCRLRHGAPEPEDIAQLTFTRLMAWGGSDIVNAEGFLFAIAKRLIVDHHRRQLSGATWATSAGSSEAGIDRDEITPEIVLADREQLSAFVNALQTLSAVQRNAILLSRVEGLCYSDVASILGISCSSVQKHVERGLAKCRRQINRGDTSTQSSPELRRPRVTATPSDMRRHGGLGAARVVAEVASL